MLPKSLSLDTSSEIERLQIERWRQMSAAQKAAIVSGLTQAVYDLPRAGIRHRYPNASPREQFLRLAILTLGLGEAEKPLTGNGGTSSVLSEFKVLVSIGIT